MGEKKLSEQEKGYNVRFVELADQADTLYSFLSSYCVCQNIEQHMQGCCVEAKEDFIKEFGRYADVSNEAVERVKVIKIPAWVLPVAFGLLAFQAGYWMRRE